MWLNRLGMGFCLAAMAAVSPLAMSAALAQGGGSAADSRLNEGHGVRLGGFALFTNEEFSLEYTDNVFAVEDGEEEDFFLRALANAELQSLWGRHSLGFKVGLQADEYDQFNGESSLQLTTAADGRVDVYSGTQLFGGAFYDDLVEARTSNNNRDFATILLTEKPISYNRYGGHASLVQVFNRVKGEVGGQFIWLDYEDEPLIGGGISDQDVRDYRQDEYTGRLHYIISPDTSIFIGGSLTEQEYDITGGAFDRSGDGYSANVGSVFKMGSRLLEGSVHAGVKSQGFDNPAFEDVDIFDYGFGVTWFFTQLTTFEFTGTSAIQASTLAAASSSVNREFGLNVAHELTRFVNLDGTISYGTNEFEGVNRSDTRWGAGLKASYELNRWLDAFAQYEFLNQDSDTFGNSFNTNTISVGLSISG